MSANAFMGPTLLRHNINASTSGVLFSMVRMFHGIMCLHNVTTKFISRMRAICPSANVARSAIRLGVGVFTRILLQGDSAFPVPSREIFKRFVTSNFVTVAITHLFNVERVGRPIVQGVSHLPIRAPLLQVRLKEMETLVVSENYLNRVIRMLHSTTRVFLQ